jgi:hypothetical protein
VHDGQRGGDPLVEQVGVEALELLGGEHPLVASVRDRQRGK